MTRDKFGGALPNFDCALVKIRAPGMRASEALYLAVNILYYIFYRVHSHLVKSSFRSWLVNHKFPCWQDVVGSKRQ